MLSWAAITVALCSAFVVDRDTVSCLLWHQETTSYPILKTSPVVDLLLSSQHHNIQLVCNFHLSCIINRSGLYFSHILVFIEPSPVEGSLDFACTDSLLPLHMKYLVELTLSRLSLLPIVDISFHLVNFCLHMSIILHWLSLVLRLTCFLIFQTSLRSLWHISIGNEISPLLFDWPLAHRSA